MAASNLVRLLVACTTLSALRAEPQLKHDPVPVAAHNFSVAGYLPEWRYGGANFDQMFRHLSHLIFFSIEPTPDGALTGLDRLPWKEVLEDAIAAARVHGTKLMICLGGNGRSSGFAAATRSLRTRSRLVSHVVKLIAKLGLDGVDYNWEYPGYSFGAGYAEDDVVASEWDGLAALVTETRAAFIRKWPKRALVVSLAYYPDGRQEAELAKRGLVPAADLLHAMSYDAPGPNHSPMSLAESVISKATAAGLPLSAVTLGVPFYGRSTKTGDWTTYEDIVQKHHPLPADVDSVLAVIADKGSPAKKSGGSKTAAESIGFNGAATIAAKTRLAVDAGLGGLMIWESGQDCRAAPVTRGGTTHVRTCPGPEGGDPATGGSLHEAISRELGRAGVHRAFSTSGGGHAAAAAAAGVGHEQGGEL